MKRILLTITALIFAVNAHAHIMVKMSSGAASTDICTSLQGQWHGSGVIEKQPFFSCSYHGDGEVTGGEPYSFNMHLTKDEGGFMLCPQEKELILVGSCNNNGELTVSTYGVDLTGTTDGRKADLEGKVTSPIPATIRVHIER